MIGLDVLRNETKGRETGERYGRDRSFGETFRNNSALASANKPAKEIAFRGYGMESMLTTLSAPAANSCA